MIHEKDTKNAKPNATLHSKIAQNVASYVDLSQ